MFYLSVGLSSSRCSSKYRQYLISNFRSAFIQLNRLPNSHFLGRQLFVAPFQIAELALMEVFHSLRVPVAEKSKAVEESTTRGHSSLLSQSRRAVWGRQFAVAESRPRRTLAVISLVKASNLTSTSGTVYINASMILCLFSDDEVSLATLLRRNEILSLQGSSLKSLTTRNTAMILPRSRAGDTQP